jgi:hypothetical protein
VSLLEDAERAYEDARERSRLLKAEWERLNRPVLSTGSRGQVIAHPLLAAMNEADVIVDRLRQRMMQKHPGPSPSAVPGIASLSPAARLRAVSSQKPAGVP